MNYRGRTAVITGAASGIGRGLAREAAARGMNVIMCDLDIAALEAVAEELTGKGGAVITRRTDVTDADSVAALADEAFSTFGAVHLLFNNAGVYVDGTSWKHPASQWDWMLDIDVKGVVNGMNAFLPRMISSGEVGIMANTASIAGLMSFPYVGCYGAAKHAVVALTESVHFELVAAGSQVRAALLCPGAVVTGIADSASTNALSVTSIKDANPAASLFHDAFKGIIAQGMTPEAHAAFVFDELALGRFWIISDRSYLSQIEERMQSIKECRAPRFNQ